MITPEQAREFAQKWVAAWNTHDVKTLLSFCAEGFEMSSPLVADLGAESSGTIHGRDAVGAYWERMLARAPTLRFDLVDVLTGVGSVVVVFRMANGRMAAQMLEFGADGKLARGAAHFAL